MERLGNRIVKSPMQAMICDSTVMKMPTALSTAPTLSAVPPYSFEMTCSSVTQPLARRART